ncbi:retrovirus-related pol polyprotein from transposon TNT 1-94 [Tanacetum coccineum]
MKAIFNQMETKVAKCYVDKKYFEIEIKELSLDNDRLLEHIICQDHENDRLMELLISQDLVHTVVNSLAAINDYKSMQQSFMDEYNETLVLKAELAKKHDMIEKAVYNELSKRCSRLKNRIFFIINELQAHQLKEKNVSIEKLKEHIANIKRKNVVESGQNVHNSNGNALTWWNSHVKTDYLRMKPNAMTWKTLKKMMTDKYCPRGKIKKLEIKMWNLKVKGIDVVGYNQCFQELALMCDRMFPEESNMIEKYVDGLPT